MLSIADRTQIVIFYFGKNSHRERPNFALHYTNAEMSLSRLMQSSFIWSIMSAALKSCWLELCYLIHNKVDFVQLILNNITLDMINWLIIAIVISFSVPSIHSTTDVVHCIVLYPYPWCRFLSLFYVQTYRQLRLWYNELHVCYDPTKLHFVFY